jgi:hypothetical protein
MNLFVEMGDKQYGKKLVGLIKYLDLSVQVRNDLYWEEYFVYLYI